MFKKIVEFFTGKKPESKFAHPLDAVTAPYKVEPPSSTTHHPGHPGWPVPVKVDLPPQPATTPIPHVPEPPLVKLGPEPTPEAARPAKKKQTFAKKTAAAKTPAAKAPAKPRAKKSPQ